MDIVDLYVYFQSIFATVVMYTTVKMSTHLQDEESRTKQSPVHVHACTRCLITDLKQLFIHIRCRFRPIL